MATKKTASPSRAKTPAKKPADRAPATGTEQGDEIEALFVRTARQASRRRVGFTFDLVAYGIALDVLSEAQIQAIEADPHLVVERCFMLPGGEKIGEAQA